MKYFSRKQIFFRIQIYVVFLRLSLYIYCLVTRICDTKVAYLFFFFKMCLIRDVKPQHFLTKALQEISKNLSLEKFFFQVTHYFKSLLNWLTNHL